MPRGTLVLKIMITCSLIFLFPFNTYSSGNTNRQAVIKEYDALVRFMVEWEKNNSKLPAPSEQDQKYSFIYRHLRSFQEQLLSSAQADGSETCLFGGWVSKKSPKGLCQVPWLNRAYAKSLDTTGYGPACGGSLFRCNPAIFGGKDAPCVETSKSYSGLTEKCQEKMKDLAAKKGKTHWLESLSDEEFAAWETKTFAPLKKQAMDFCSGPKEPYNDKTCSALKQAIESGDQESTRRKPKAPVEVSDGCVNGEGEKVPNETKEMKLFYKAPAEGQTKCDELERTRYCKNNAYTEWDGDKEFHFEACPKTDAAPVVPVTEKAPCGTVVHGGSEKRTVKVAPACGEVEQTHSCDDGKWSEWSGPDDSEKCKAPTKVVIEKVDGGPQPDPVIVKPKHGKVLGVSIVGGSNTDAFYKDGVEDFVNGFLGLKSDSKVYYGGPARKQEGKVCGVVYPDKVEVKGAQVPVSQLKKELQPPDCKNLDQVRNMMMGITGSDEDCKEKVVLPNGAAPTGEATKAGLASALNEGDSLQPGETFFLNITGHGEKRENDVWAIQLSDKTMVTTEEVKAKIKELTAKGVHVQLNANACYSGGFSKVLVDLQKELMDKGTKGMTCATSAQDADMMGYGSDALLTAGYQENFYPALGKYGNQLSAAACASGADVINTPTNSLSEYVRDWHKKKETKFDQEAISKVNCGEQLNTAFDMELKALAENMKDIKLKVEREALLADIQEYWVKPLKECWKDSQEDLDFSKHLFACIEKNPDQNEMTQAAEPGLKKLLSSIKGASSDFAELLGFTKFIENKDVGEEDLKRFKADFCCLGRNLKTGAMPTSCQ